MMRDGDRQALDTFFDFLRGESAKWQTNEIIALPVGKKAAAVGQDDAEFFGVFLQGTSVDVIGQVQGQKEPALRPYEIDSR